MSADSSLLFYNLFFSQYDGLIKELPDNEKLTAICYIDGVEPFKILRITSLCDGFFTIESLPDEKGDVLFHIVNYSRFRIVIKKSVKDPDDKKDYGFTLR